MSGFPSSFLRKLGLICTREQLTICDNISSNGRTIIVANVNVTNVISILPIHILFLQQQIGEQTCPRGRSVPKCGHVTRPARDVLTMKINANFICKFPHKMGHQQTSFHHQNT